MNPCLEATKERSYVISRILASVMFLIIIAGPCIVQIIFQTRTDSPEPILFWAGIVQTALSIAGGIGLGVVIAVHDNALYTDMWCSPCTKLEAMFYGGFTIYYLPGWVVLNACSSWYYINNGVTLNWYTHLAIYGPLLAYGPSVLFGWACKKRW
jgi:hypothetical protein